MRNKNKMTQNDVRIGWVQKQVMMCWFVTSATFCSKWLKLLTIYFLVVLMGNNIKMTENLQKKCG